MFLGFLGKNPCAHNLACARRVVHTCTWTCLETLFLFIYFFLFSHMYTYVWPLFRIFLLLKLLFHMFNFWFVPHMLELRFVYCLIVLMPWTRIHVFMHNVIGVELLQRKWGKSCICDVHAFMIWSCLGLMLWLCSWCLGW